MPIRAKSPCRHPGCGHLLDKSGFCDKHRRESFRAQKQTATEDYKERNRFYQRKEWKTVRALKLQLDPLCKACRTQGRLTAAEVVDHIVQISRGGSQLDQDNLQSLCKSCHNAKTMREKQGGSECS